MPKRANLFQDVVAIVHEIVNPGATIKRSAMIEHDQTRDRREVDLWMIVQSANGETSVGIEATSRGRKANVEWVEQQIMKHCHVGTDQLVLVSDSGFSGQAQRLAESNDVVTVTPTDIEKGAVRAQIVNRVPTLHPRTLELGIDLFAVVVNVQEMSEPLPVLVEPTVVLRLEDGRSIGSVRGITEQLLDARDGKVIDDAGLLRGGVDRSATTVLQFPAPRAISDSGKEVKMWVDLTRWGKPWPTPVQAILARASYHLRVGEGVVLKHRHIAGVDVAYGESQVFDDTLTFVASALDGVERFTVEVRERSGGQGALREVFNAYPQPLASQPQEDE